MDTNQMMTQEDEIVIDLKGILIDLWRKAPLIILIGVITAAIGFLYSSFMLTPVYTSTTKVYAMNRADDKNYVTAAYADFQLGSMITEDCAQLIKSRYVAEEVVKRLELDLAPAVILGELSVTTSEDTRIIGITITDPSPVRAKQLADAVREVSSEYIQSVMGLEAVNMVEEANLPTVKSGPNIPKYTLMGAFAGLFLMCAIFVLRFILNDAIRTLINEVLFIIESNIFPNMTGSNKANITFII